MRIGVDIGGVIVKKDYEDKDEDTTFNQSHPMFFDHCFEVLKELSERHKLFIISYCGRKREEETRKVLLEVGLDKIIPEEHWYFVRSRKAKLEPARRLNLDIMIDDTQEIHDLLLSNLKGITGIWFNGQGKSRKRLLVVDGWDEIRGIL